jgi:hypothetical protein
MLSYVQGTVEAMIFELLAKGKEISNNDQNAVLINNK